MTVKQKQLLLAYLGYYGGDIDGKFGKLSKEATKKFQEDYCLNISGAFDEDTTIKIKEVVYTEEKPLSVWDIVKHFKRKEFKCKCGKYCNGFPVEPQSGLVKLLENLRIELGVAISVNSGVRCKTHNRNVNGVKNSRHLLGKAADIKAKGKSANDIISAIDKIGGARYRYAINKNSVHVDIE